jgi:hypothetical protein
MLVAYSCPGCGRRCCWGYLLPFLRCTSRLQGHGHHSTHTVFCLRQEPEDKPHSPIIALSLYAKHRHANPHVPCNLQACLRQPSQHAFTNSSLIASSNMLPTVYHRRNTANNTRLRFEESIIDLLTPVAHDVTAMTRCESCVIRVKNATT